MMNRPMMGKFSLLFLISLSANLYLSGSANAKSSYPADSLRIKSINGNQFILHKVDPAETWIKLSRRYDCSVEELQEANPGVVMLKIDQIVHVPLKNRSTQNTATTTPPVLKSSSSEPKQVTINGTPIIHQVKPGETLFGISTKYNQPVEKIIELNKLSNDIINVGQNLIVKYNQKTENKVVAQTDAKMVVVPPSQPKGETVMASTTSTPSVIEKTETTVTTPAAEISVTRTAENHFELPTRTVTPIGKKNNSGKTTVQVVETGVGTWIQDGQFTGDKFYGLHRTAPIGTIIKVTNRMNNLFAYVKVVGALPDTGDNSNVIIKMSQAVSTKLNVLDPLFQVELSYGMIQ